jgi:hypothetical protein
MANFKIWYVKEIRAKNISEAIKKEKKISPEFHSIESDRDDEQEHISAIGFQTYTESDYEDW